MNSKYSCTKKEAEQSMERLKKLGFKEPTKEQKDITLNSLTTTITKSI
jgi:hypothetical protein